MPLLAITMFDCAEPERSTRYAVFCVLTGGAGKFITKCAPGSQVEKSDSILFTIWSYYTSPTTMNTALFGTNFAS